MDIKPEEITIEHWQSKPLSPWLHQIPRGVKITHLPTGVVVTEESDRSQHRNKEIALDAIRNKLKGQP